VREVVVPDMSELFRNALWLNYLEKPSELKFQGSE
jgi:hypothetical protein